MGMREERQESAASAISHCERLYRETGNPYYVVMALSAARTGDFKPPKWALEPLLKAVHLAAFKHNVTGARVSIDDALGLKVSRGRSPREAQAARTSVESHAFDLVRTIHACFEVSIPDACEIAYNAVDFDFARNCEECLWRPPSADLKLPANVTREQWEDVDTRHRTESERIIDHPRNPDAVKRKMHCCEWWRITNGDRLEYSLDQFIDRYYRDGTKRKGRYAKLPSNQGEFFEGYFLLLSPERCTYQIPQDYARLGAHRPIVSAVAALRQRPEFARFVETKLDAVSKYRVSAQ